MMFMTSRRRQQPSTSGQGHLRGWGVQTQPLITSDLFPVLPTSEFDFMSLLLAVTLAAKILSTGCGAMKR